MNPEVKDETKEVVIVDKTFIIKKLDPWRRLTFIADLQKEFLNPILKNTDESQLKEAFEGGNAQENSSTMMMLLSGFSNVIDGKAIEKWTKRILLDGIVIYERDDKQKAKLAFSEINKFFTSPVDIITLLKEAIMFNLEGVGDLLKAFTKKKDDKQDKSIKITEADL